ncbi:hypothetical protein, partial [Streptomyces sp. NPDC001286]
GDEHSHLIQRPPTTPVTQTSQNTNYVDQMPSKRLGRCPATYSRRTSLVDQFSRGPEDAFFQIKQHIRGRPLEFEEEASGRVQLWQKTLQQQVNKLEPIVLRIRDRALRLRLSKCAEFLAWPETSEPGLGGSAGNLTDLCDHALDCLGFIREGPLPAEGVGLSPSPPS